jgi:hypothetical protein
LKPKKSAVSLVWRFTTHSSGSRSPRDRSRAQWASMKLGTLASQINPQWAPPSLKPSNVFGSVSISRTGSRSPLT